MSTIEQVLACIRSAPPAQEEVLTGAWFEGSAGFEDSVVEGLSACPACIDCRFLYDAEGSRLFERITELSEYYPTRTEADILTRNAREIARLAGPAPLVELGAGSGEKTSLLIEAFEERHGEARYIPVDVSEAALDIALRELARRHTATRIVPIQGVHDTALAVLEEVQPGLGLFLGSSIGNFSKEQEHRFFADLAGRLRGGSLFLLGVDLVKDPAVIELAYNDGEGITHSFVRNLFARMNRELGARIDLAGFGYDARYRPDRERVEVYAHFKRGFRIRTAKVEPGEPILVEICRKFRLDTLGARMREHGLEVLRTYTDARGWFADLLIRHA